MTLLQPYYCPNPSIHSLNREELEAQKALKITLEEASEILRKKIPEYLEIIEDQCSFLGYLIADVLAFESYYPTILSYSGVVKIAQLQTPWQLSICIHNPITSARINNRIDAVSAALTITILGGMLRITQDKVIEFKTIDNPQMQDQRYTFDPQGKNKQCNALDLDIENFLSKVRIEPATIYLLEKALRELTVRKNAMAVFCERIQTQLRTREDALNYIQKHMMHALESSVRELQSSLSGKKYREEKLAAALDTAIKGIARSKSFAKSPTLKALREELEKIRSTV